jgi:hypothetical protein
MTFGYIYIAKNITGYKLGFTKIKIYDAIKNLNTSQLNQNFDLICAINVNYPKKVKNELSKEWINKRINRDLYNLSNSDIINIFIKLNDNIKKDNNIKFMDHIFSTNRMTDDFPILEKEVNKKKYIDLYS